MGSGIVVLDLDGLTCHDPKDVRMVLAAALIKHDSIVRNFKRAASQAFLHVDEYIGKIAAIDHDGFSFVRTLAAGILAHIDLGGLWSRSIKLHRTANLGGGCRINRGGGARGRCLLLGRGVGGLLGILLLIARDQQADRKQQTDCHHC